ncbi:MAG: BamA/TamA family outer membrane protein [Paludibaculum sp.]
MKYRIRTGNECCQRPHWHNYKSACWSSLAAVLLLAGGANAQEQTRAGLIEKQRAEKASKLKPDEVTPTERRMRNFREQHYMERFAAGYHGFRPKIGNMVTSGGFAIGPEYYRNGIGDGLMNFRASAQISTRGYYRMETSINMPELAKGRLAFDAVAAHRYYPSIQYYGTGPDTRKELRTNFLLEDTSVDGTLALRPWKSLVLGETSGYLWTNVGRGRDSRFASADTVYTPAQSPGIDVQTNYLRNGVFAQWDYRDNPAGPKQGGNYVMQYSWYHDNRLGVYSFRRLDVDLQQYIGFLNKTRVIALRAKARLSDTDRNEQIPFYMQPFLGGSDDLRGYRPFRFNDRNSMVLNAEYRWEIFSGLDGAIFADAGKVFPRRGLLNFRDLESSVGFGLRFNARNRTAVRVDVGFSHEGFQVWFKFNDVFASRRFGTSAGQPLY